jgi:hypothetical protein
MLVRRPRTSDYGFCGPDGHPLSCANTRSASSSMPIQRSLRIRRTHSFDALRCAESSKRLLKISVVRLIPMFRRPPVIVVFAPSRLRTLNEVNFKQHDKREVISTKVNGSPCSTADPAFAGLGDGLGGTELPTAQSLFAALRRRTAMSAFDPKRTSAGRRQLLGWS